MTQGTDYSSGYDYDDEEDWDPANVEYVPTPRPPTFEEKVATAAPYGITVTLLEGRYPVIACSVWHCPECGQQVEVRCERDKWELQEQGAAIRMRHSPDRCATILRERGPHLQWGIDYGTGEIQRWDTEEEARFYASERLGGGRYPVVCREVGGWKKAPPADPAEDPAATATAGTDSTTKGH